MLKIQPFPVSKAMLFMLQTQKSIDSGDGTGGLAQGPPSKLCVLVQMDHQANMVQHEYQDHVYWPRIISQEMGPNPTWAGADTGRPSPPLLVGYERAHGPQDKSSS